MIDAYIKKYDAIEAFREEWERIMPRSDRYLIKRSFIVNALKTIPSADVVERSRHEEIVTAYINGLENIINELKEEQTWIPCSERLPNKERKRYWICTKAGYQCECRWTNNVFGIRDSDNWGWSIFDFPQYDTVAAWMPLPEPYKEKTDE